MLDLSTRDRCFVIAEAGTAHADPEPNERFDKAIRLVRAAAEAGADAVKFQWFVTTGPYDNRWIKDDFFCWIDGDESRCARWIASIMSFEDWAQIKEYADACGLVFLASAFQGRTVRWLRDLGLAATKVASRAAKTFPYDMKSLPRPFLISTGMLQPGEIVSIPSTADPRNFIFIQCEANYPSSTPWNGRNTGFSDHSGKPFLGIDAISRGCKLLEVHFMVDPLDAGPDLPACLTTDELRLICEARDYYAERRAA